MPAEVEVVSFNGAAPGTPNAVTSDRYNASDRTDPGLDYANQVPGAGLINRSYRKARGLHVKGGNFSRLSNFRWGGPEGVKTTWALGAKGGKIQVALKDSPLDAGCPIAEYTQAQGVEGEYGYDIKHADYGDNYYKNDVIACGDIDSYTADNPLAFDSSIITAIGYTKLVFTQLVLYDDTTFGEKTIIYEFWKWREI